MNESTIRAALVAASLAVTTLPALAQDLPHAPKYRVDLALGAGDGEHTTDGTNLDGKTDAGFFRIGFEGIGNGDFGGGARLESWATDDDLFGVPAEASSSTLFAHFTWRTTGERFAMPIRFGLLLNGYEVSDNTNGDDLTSSNFGLMAEIAPEVVLVSNESFQWSALGSFGLGTAVTAIEADGIGDDFTSNTTFLGAEVGTRFRFDQFDIGLSYAYRRQSMDESDEDNGFVILGYDAEFSGVLLTFGFSW
jgi:hypothetical protein